MNLLNAAIVAVFASASKNSASLPSTKLSAKSNIQEQPTPKVQWTPSLQIEIFGNRSNNELESAKKSIITRLFDEGYCLNNTQADFQIVVFLDPDRSQITLRGNRIERTFSIIGQGDLATLELMHRLESELYQLRKVSIPCPRCVSDAILIRPGPTSDPELFYQWVYALSQTEHSIVRARVPKDQQLCLSVDHKGIRLGTGKLCQTKVYSINAISSRKSLDKTESIPPTFTKSEIDRIVGASLMHHAFTSKPSSPAKMKRTREAPLKPRKEPTNRKETFPILAPLSKQASPRRARFRTFAGAGVANRRGGTDGTIHLQAGVLLQPKILFSTSLSVTSAFLKEKVIATDIDLGGIFEYLWPLTNRYGLRATGSGGFRQHRYYSALHRHRAGKATWFAGTSLFFWHELRKSFNVEIGIQQRFYGHAWAHEVGIQSIGQRGRYQATLIVGFSWQGIRR